MQVTSLLSSDAFLEVISQLVGVANKDEGAAGHADVQEKGTGHALFKTGQSENAVQEHACMLLLWKIDDGGCWAQYECLIS